MNISFKELVDVMGDRDYFTISAAAICLIAYLRLDLGEKIVVFIVALTIIIRLLSIENRKQKLIKLDQETNQCLQYILTYAYETKEPEIYTIYRVFSNPSLSDEFKQMVIDKYEKFKKKADVEFRRLSNRSFY